MNDFSYRIDAGCDAQQLLLLLHGYGSNQHDIASIIPEIDPQGHFVTVSPLGPIAVPGGGASWYDFDEHWQADPQSFHSTLSALNSFVETMCTRYDIDMSNRVIGGFSQGAGVAAWLAFGGRSTAPSGFWCCGTVVDVDGESLDVTDARGRDVLILAGRDDPNVPLERNRAQAQRFYEAGAHTTVSEHEGGHGLSTAMLNDMNQWLAAIPRPASIRTDGR